MAENPNPKTPTDTYFFGDQTYKPIASKHDLDMLVQDRRRRGFSEDNIALLELWHTMKVQDAPLI